MDDRFVLVVLIVAIIVIAGVGIRRGWVTRPRGGFSAMTVYHDWSSQPVQEGVEVIVERNAKKKEEEQFSGEPDFEEKDRERNKQDNSRKDSEPL